MKKAILLLIACGTCATLYLGYTAFSTAATPTKSTNEPSQPVLLLINASSKPLTISPSEIKAETKNERPQIIEGELPAKAQLNLGELSKDKFITVNAGGFSYSIRPGAGDPDTSEKSGKVVAITEKNTISAEEKKTDFPSSGVYKINILDGGKFTVEPTASLVVSTNPFTKSSLPVR
ncbi:MAG: hypothetical protein U1E02_06375 [Hydrogenophaga sp.]|nr:hypothetical protein [Hydrogenophaga sp.]